MVGKNEKKFVPCVVCGGQTGRAVVYGYVERIPEPGELVKIYKARMVIRFGDVRGLFGLCTNGPASNTRLTSVVSEVNDTCRQSLSVSKEAAEKLDKHTTW